jgi:hypothetical protein
MSEELKILLNIKKEKLQKMLIKDTIKLSVRPKRHLLFGNYSINQTICWEYNILIFNFQYYVIDSMLKLKKRRKI